MYKKSRMFLSIFWVVLGFGLNVGYFAGLLDDYWQTMGIAFIVVGALQLLRHLRYHKDGEYREKVDTATHDERNKFLANKAWAWTGYWFVLIAGIGTIGFKLAGREDLMMFCSSSVCLMILLYWANYLYLSRKY